MRQLDGQIEELLKDLKKDRAQLAQLTKIDLAEVSPTTRQQISQMLAEQLRGQLPPKLAKALNEGSADPALLNQLVGRLANAWSPTGKPSIAATPDAARQAASSPDLMQTALRWTQFVQLATNVAGGGVQGRAGSAAPKGAQALFAEAMAAKLAGNEGPSLRMPLAVARELKNLTPAQRDALMVATFGKDLTLALQQVGINDPLTFVKAGALPQDRAILAQSLNMPRARLLGLLMQAELLKVGPGRNGELGMRPQLLQPLREAGVVMLATLGSLRSLSTEELRHIYRKLRLAAGGFKHAVTGERVPVKRDLLHWARTAARKKSDILLADSEEFQGKMTRGDAQELVQAWYQENLLWAELDRARQRTEELWRREQERQRKEQDHQGEPAWLDDDAEPEFEYDDHRDDHLMCFWLSEHITDDVRKRGAMKRMYVCVDPDTGAIIPQTIEREDIPSR